MLVKHIQHAAVSSSPPILTDADGTLPPVTHGPTNEGGLRKHDHSGRRLGPASPARLHTSRSATASAKAPKKLAGHNLKKLFKALLASTAAATGTSSTTTGDFSTGLPQLGTVGASGCGANVNGEPSIHVSKANQAGHVMVLLGSERGLGGGSDAWRDLNGAGGPGASACTLEYRGQPNAVNGFGLAGGDIDTAIAPELNSAGTYTDYVASLNLGSVAVAHSTDNGTTWVNIPVQKGLPVDDREWIAAFGPATSLLSFHDIPTGNIDVLRSDDSGTTYVQISQAIPALDSKASNNQIGNLVIDHLNTAGTVSGPLGLPGFWAYQSFVAPSQDPGLAGSSAYNEAFVAVSNDGGFTWTDRPIPGSITSSSKSNGLNHQFPNISVDPLGNLWAAWSDDVNIYVAKSPDHGQTWTAPTLVSSNTARAVMPWLVATSAGVDLVYYGSPTATNQTWSVYFAQNLTSTASGWGTPQPVVAVHQGPVCESGFSCTGGRQLFDDFGVDTDPSGWAHIAYSQDAPSLGGPGTYTGYAVQIGGTPVGFPN